MEIVDAIENNDKDALVKMFSAAAMDEIDMAVFEQSMDELFNEWQGEMVKYDGELSTGKNRHSGNELYHSEDFYWQYNREPGIYVDKSAE